MRISSFSLGPVGRLDWFRAGLGAICSLFVTTMVAQLWLGDQSGLPALVAPMGASAVLLFALPSSPLARPWSVLGGNVISALIGVGCAKMIAPVYFSAPLAVGLAIMTMRLCRCLHPPGGAAALTAVIGGTAIVQAGWSFAFIPVGLNSIIMIAMALLFNNMTGQRYPHRIAAPAASPRGTRDIPPEDRAGFTLADIDAVLARYNELLDVSRDDLDILFRQVEAQAHSRLHHRLRCGDIMSRDVITAQPEQGVGQARDILLARHLSAMPVVDADNRLCGLVGHAELLAGAGRLVQDVQRLELYKAGPETLVDELLPALSSGEHHEAMVVDSDGKLLGMITQTDLLATLWRGHIAEHVARGDGLSAPA